jgi:hypothetical protein
MSVWTAASTLLVFSPPAGSSGLSVPAVGQDKVLSGDEFSKLWKAFFFNEQLSSPLCGAVRELALTDAQLIEQDRFLVFERGFRKSVCQPSSWFVSSMRIDTCRVRLGHGNKNKFQLRKCSQDGKYSEIRIVIQPVEKTDRGSVFPDTAMHLAFSVPNLNEAARVWRSRKADKIISYLKKKAVPNDVSLFLGGAGLERWTFARLVYSGGLWVKDKLPHGGYFESFSDADLGAGVIRTQRPAAEPALTDTDLLNPLRVHPLQGSCFSCHMAGHAPAGRMFRHLGWGLSGESVVSPRVRAEADLAARELQNLGY